MSKMTTVLTGHVDSPSTRPLQCVSTVGDEREKVTCWKIHICNRLCKVITDSGLSARPLIVPNIHMAWHPPQNTVILLSLSLRYVSLNLNSRTASRLDMKSEKMIKFFLLL